MESQGYTGRQVFNIVGFVVIVLLWFFDVIPGWLAFVGAWAIFLWPDKS